MALVQNPVLPGFNPDPSIVCTGDDFYIATSTFEWFPGVQIHHSKDLASWELVAHPLDRVSQLDLKGVPCSGGVWAPDISYYNGTYYLIYSVVRNFGKPFYDVCNYLVTSPAVDGPWSDPVFLNSSGFDPSLFHDNDGRAWLVNMFFDYRTWKVRFGGIVLQEFSESEHKLTGKPEIIFTGTPAGTTEGPHLYRKDGYYYLLCAEGGTSYKHQAIIARSRSLKGPYETDPHNPLVTSYPYPADELQKSGHASMVQGPDGNWYLAHLCSRPAGRNKGSLAGGCCILGRETAVEQVVWKDGWPSMKQGSDKPLKEWESPFSVAGRKTAIYWKDDFEGKTWNINFQSLRVPLGGRASLLVRRGWLRLYGKETLGSCFEQSLLACRQQHFYMQVQTKIDFKPLSFQQTAGLVYYYDTSAYYYAYITADEQQGRMVSMMCCREKQITQPLGAGIAVPAEGDITLRLVTAKETAQFFYSLAGRESFTALGPVLDATVLSDDYFEQHGMGNRFTGSFAGICCQDISGAGLSADFDYFEYRELPSPGILG